ncbi:hypothetical protein [Streptomyces caatingaensis]|uniref:Uncharacterized protein n=1 Tax=Streptomyces caatingaensis TaxID=1678637 RepID=A0A0K9XCM8_9ACTN|nr:hypothetical protein [Streptomyces caatingaensis]KNB50983.1 hypothetical protein AC230_17655 [Streptomyces caatingaensis]
MAVGVYLENRLHERIAHVCDDADESFIEACKDAPDGSFMRMVHPWGDTMFNELQLEPFLQELRETPDERRTVAISKVIDLAEQAIARHGYLYFVGD